MNKRRLVEEIVSRTRLPPRDVAKVVDTLIDVVTSSVVAGEKIVLSGFGTFHRKTRAERTARNISTGESVKVKAMNVPAFRAGQPFKNAVAEASRRRAARVARRRTSREDGSARKPSSRRR